MEEDLAYAPIIEFGTVSDTPVRHSELTSSQTRLGSVDNNQDLEI